MGRATWALSDGSQGGEEWLLDRRRYACQNASKGVSFVSVVNLDEIGYHLLIGRSFDPIFRLGRML